MWPRSSRDLDAAVVVDVPPPGQVWSNDARQPVAGRSDAEVAHIEEKR